jgi:hypothetical protein
LIETIFCKHAEIGISHDLHAGYEHARFESLLNCEPARESDAHALQSDVLNN